MNTAGKIMAGLGLILASSIGYFTLDYLEFSHKKDTFCNLQVKDISNGDLVFRKGRSVESYAVYMADKQKEFSHVGIICFENGVPFVIHAVPGENGEGPDFIKKDKLTDFLDSRKVSRYAVLRARFPAEQNGIAARNALQYYLEKRTFDDQYDLNTDDKLYCTELVIKAFSSAGIDLKGIKLSGINIMITHFELILPGEFFENTSFRRVF